MQLQKETGKMVYALLNGVVGSAKYAEQNDKVKEALIMMAIVNGRKITPRLRKLLGVTDDGDSTIELESGVLTEEDLRGYVDNF